ncbi:type I glyceraldehyde-3-phosphate dehydrogenase [Endozoicomonas elysicola]|uniref:Glyceraldehyde-3-phosphate dehydrogenase n=1 Tax=Endozoicomonas elysicola TaxID=305900 RepID=A0A081K6T5_9GAMM|nr:glyceraldehyde 3-phosphate dehydrogenase NAD-binding domain-containing protein [Endozoicomonas elysicola]KEI69861.1 glyceraldehyde-3-phosphate dehydrogenase [Endozoicomonas elysicola]
MTYRVAINGYGRIGQCVLRALYENGYRHNPLHGMEVVAINELANIETLAYLTRYDTTHGRFPGKVSANDTHIFIGDDRIRVFNEPSPQQLDWQALDIDLLLECSGSFNDRETAELHIERGASRLLFSQPAKPDVDATIVYGINEEQLNPRHRIVSSASCTTNCIVPVLKTLNDSLGIEYGSMTTIHSAMNDQPVIDAYHQNDLRLTRSALHSIIPVDTGLARGINRLLPELKGRFKTSAIRVPTINVSCIDLTVQVSRDTSKVEVNRILEKATFGRLEGILSITNEPHASVDFNHDTRSCIVDGTQTQVSGHRLVRLLCWFDNEWGFANRMLDIASYWLALPKGSKG